MDQDYANINAPAFAGAVAGTPTAVSFAGAQAARTGTIMGNITAPGGGVQTPMAADAPPGASGEKAVAMQAVTDQVKNQAQATGNLGGYGDSWFNSGLADQAAGRQIGIGNLFANETKSLIAPEQDLAAAAAYQPSPASMFGALLTGAGSMLGSYSGKNVSPNGAQLPFGAGSFFAPTPSDMLSGMYSPSGSS